MLFFEKRVGHVIAVEDAHVDASVKLLGFERESEEIGFQTTLSVVTSVGFQQRPNYQLANSIGRTLYLYVFGDRPGNLTIDGLSFMADCDKDLTVMHGVEKLQAWYDENKLSTRREPMRMTLGTKGFDALIAGFDYRLADAVQYTAIWSLHLDTLPELVT